MTLHDIYQRLLDNGADASPATLEVASGMYWSRKLSEMREMNRKLREAVQPLQIVALSCLLLMAGCINPHIDVMPTENAKSPKVIQPPSLKASFVELQQWPDMRVSWQPTWMASGYFVFTNSDAINGWALAAVTAKPECVLRGQQRQFVWVRATNQWGMSK